MGTKEVSSALPRGARMFELPPDGFDPMTAPADELRQGGAVSVSCNYCKRIVPLDLQDMVKRGLGDRPLVRLPLRCRACGSRSFGMISHTGHSGPSWNKPRRETGE